MSDRIHKAKGLTEDFLILRNDDVQRTDLSYEAVGLLTYLMSLPPDWIIYVSTLERKGMGRDRLKKTIKELIDNGYLFVEQKHDEKGQFATNEYHAYAMPEYNPHWKPSTENPSTVKPFTENPQLQSKDSKKENKEKDIALEAPSNSKQKPFYDAIKALFNIDGGRNANMQKMLEGIAKDAQHKPYNLSPAMGLDEFLQWSKYAESLGQYMPKSPEKVQSSIMTWREKKSKPVSHPKPLSQRKAPANLDMLQTEKD